ncbi:MAG: potassium-transporting ATPase KdpC subunit [Solirubrobacteraceae bacterium]|jgi:K+-transporting ATPase ATPase C chain|nr:potassium-transporting ATPase KdpC subunit [Solirubrobacteraceae bacterium]
MKRDAITAAIGIIVFTLFCGIVYPLVITGISQVAFPGNANGQQVFVHGKLVGSKIIGQSFEYQVLKNGKLQVTSTKGPLLAPELKYFQTRPSSTGEPYINGGTPDNAGGTAFSNLGPNSTITEGILAGNIAAYIALDKSPNGTPYYPGGLTAATVPVDAVDSSASSVDPDISVRNADIQAYRVAAIRHLSLTTVDKTISTYTAGRGIGFSGEPGVNVLELNLALDRQTGGS